MVENLFFEKENSEEESDFSKKALNNPFITKLI